MARQLKRITQAELGMELGVSFQQIQKYEKGANRLSASKLMKAAEVLEVSPSFFFGELGAEVVDGRLDPEMTALVKLLSSGDALELNVAFARIKSGRVRVRIITLVQEIAATYISDRKKPNG
jgi:transcriptional regulator with XRE-family HTH domain